ncbi:MAG: hypothetical protein HYS24_14010 [Ignavibacteriales bacterium]|nr:hypothetical protein [Ignavibacteriales bacterium]
MKIKKVFLSVLLLGISSIISVAQDNPTQDSTKINSEFKLRLNDNSMYISPLRSFQIPEFEDPYSQLILPDLYEQNPQTEAVSLMQLRNNINQSMQVYHQGMIKNDLGVVGKILGYTNAAAAIGLAAYHVYKYKEHYGFKKK